MSIISPITSFSVLLYDYFRPTTNTNKLYIPGLLYSTITSLASIYIFSMCPNILYFDFTCLYYISFKPLIYFSQGYSFTEIVNAAINYDIQYIIHGSVFFIAATYTILSNQHHLCIVPLLMENSTVWFNLIIVYKSIYLRIMFMLTFLYFRWYIFVIYSYYSIINYKLDVFPFMILFNIMNFYWGFIIINKTKKLLIQSIYIDNNPPKYR